jgi:sulfur-oxidizing protein SoxY
MKNIVTRRKFLALVAATGTALTLPGTLIANHHRKIASPAWDAVREHLFQDREIFPGDGVVEVIAPVRPPNGGDVTVRIMAAFPQTPERFLKKHYLVVDENPSPVAGVFTLTPESGIADVNARIRVNAYSNVRVISETSDGHLYMDSTFVKASGGCSAPPMNNDPLLKLAMGKTTLLNEGKASNGTYKFHLSVVHPSYSGLQKDQITLLYIAPHYVENIEVKNHDGDVIFAVSGDISFSENPSFGFHYAPHGNEDSLSVRIMDSRKKTFESQWPVSSA